MAEVTDATLVEEAAPKKRGKKGLLFGLIAGLALGGASFYAVLSGLFDPAALLGGGDAEHAEAEEAEIAAPAFAFVPMEPIMISLPPGSASRHLRFTGQLEVEPPMTPEVTALMPRIIDTLNTYLRAVEVRDLESPSAIQRLRAQMLRRVQVVTGEGRVRDLLITEFILN